jgi:hypothetical protein
MFGGDPVMDRILSNLPLSIFSVFTLVILACAKPVWAQAPANKELIAVLDLDIQGATKEQGSALTDRLREELLRTGQFILVDRSQLQDVLKEQALQQSGCTSQECAVQVGRILGIRKIVSGKLTKVGENLWQVSGMLLDVETAQTLRAESVLHEGSFVGLLTQGAVSLAAKMSGTVAPPAGPALRFGQVFLMSEPPGADVILDGQPRPEKTDALLEKVPEGEHTIVLRKGNQAATGKVAVKADAIARLLFKLEAASSTVIVTSKPFNAKVLLDGAESGQTPAQLQTTVGNHQIDIVLEGYLPFSKRIEVSLSAENRVHGDLVQGGTLEIIGGGAGTEILIDGKKPDPLSQISSQGVSSVQAIASQFLLAPGVHAIEIKREGFVPRTERVEIKAGGTTRLNAALLPVQGTLTIAGVAEGTSVTVSGGDFSPTLERFMVPIKARPLPVGRYNVVAEAPGYVEETRQAVVEPNRDTVVDIRQVRSAQLSVQTDPNNLLGGTNDIEVLLDGKRITGVVEAAPGTHTLAVSDRNGDYARQERKIELKPGETREESFHLEHSASYLAKQSYETKSFWWKLSNGTVVAGFFIAGGLALSEYSAVQQSNKKQKDLADKAKSSTTQVEFDGYVAEIAAERKNGLKHADQTESYSKIAGGFAVVWLALHAMKPESPRYSFLILPAPDGETGARAVIAMRW